MTGAFFALGAAERDVVTKTGGLDVVGVTRSSAKQGHHVHANFPLVREDMCPIHIVPGPTTAAPAPPRRWVLELGCIVGPLFRESLTARVISN